MFVRSVYSASQHLCVFCTILHMSALPLDLLISEFFFVSNDFCQPHDLPKMFTRGLCASALSPIALLLALSTMPDVTHESYVTCETNNGHQRAVDNIVTCWLVVADSTDLSSRILRNLGNRREMPFSESTWTDNITTKSWHHFLRVNACVVWLTGK